ncbi:cytochrome P450 [Striga asiatica]|uniref:Cytochrome P450 n=1 Tax=Striga asiatica TaxID=4170 RepID=A0A5A7QIG1_STRAF|nr:cytochrome P450 [Striga asiatica]
MLSPDRQLLRNFSIDGLNCLKPRLETGMLHELDSQPILQPSNIEVVSALAEGSEQKGVDQEIPGSPSFHLPLTLQMNDEEVWQTKSRNAYQSQVNYRYKTDLMKH